MKTQLTGSQKRSLASYALLLLGGINAALTQAQSAHLALPLWVSSLVIPAVAGGVMLLSRSLDKTNSGSGSGIMGGPATGSALPAAGTPPIAVPSPQEIALAVQPLLAAGLDAVVVKMNAEKAVVKTPVLSEVLDLLLTNASALTEPRQLALLAAAGTHLTEQSGETAQTLMGAKKAEGSALLAGIAQKADEVKADEVKAPEEPKQTGVIAQVAQVVGAILGKPEDKAVTQTENPGGEAPQAETQADPPLAPADA